MGMDHVLTLVAFGIGVAIVLWWIVSNVFKTVKKPKAIHGLLSVIFIMICYIARTVIHVANGLSYSVDLFMVGLCIISIIFQFVSFETKVKNHKAMH